MSDLVNFRENLKDSITNSLLDYINYLHETKNHSDVLENGNNALAKCEVMCGELFSNKVRKGEATQEDIDSFEALLPTEGMLVYNNNDINLAQSIIKEGNAMALNEYESTYGSNNKSIGQKIA